MRATLINQAWRHHNDDPWPESALYDHTPGELIASFKPIFQTRSENELKTRPKKSGKSNSCFDGCGVSYKSQDWTIAVEKARQTSHIDASNTKYYD
jgi:hypothetical protein